MKVYINITATEITATPAGYDKAVKAQFASFGGAQKPFKWNGTAWVIEGSDKVAYWADRVSAMFIGWKTSPAVYNDLR